MKNWLTKYKNGGDKSKDVNYGDDYSKSKSNMNMLELSKNTPAPKKNYKFDPKTIPNAPANMQEAQQMVDAKEKHKDKVTASEKLAYSRLTKSQKEKYDAAKAKDEYVNNPGLMDYASQIGYIPLLAMSNPFNMGEKLKELRAIKVNDNLSPWQKFDQMGNVSTEATGNALINAATDGLVEGIAPAIISKGKELLSNTYKLNPLSNKLGKYNRVVGEDAILDMQTSDLVRAGNKGGVGTGILKRTTPYPSFKKGNPGQTYIDQTIKQGKTPYIISTDRPMNVSTLGTHGKGSTQFPIDELGNYMTNFPASEAKIFEGQPHWLKGYKEVPKTLKEGKSNFKSEIDWGNWNKEIPDNKGLMDEYHTIEQTSKSNKSWMKNPDGSEFDGTPEQFVQQNSKNFKKAFPEGSENVFRGTGENIAELRPNRSIFTANQELASGYAPFNKKSIFLNSESGEGGVHSFYRKNSKNSLELDANNTSWTSVDLSNKRLTKDYFERNIKSQEDQITKQKEYLSKMKQNPNGSWEAPDGTTYSNDLYKNTVAERELYLKDLKERYKNIDNLISNPKELEEMKKVLGNTTTTDDIAAYVEKRNLDYVKLKNIEDSGVGDVTIINHKPGNYLKSAIGNNGMFDMNNPNIYKALVPAIAGSAAYGLQEKKNGGWLTKFK